MTARTVHLLMVHGVGRHDPLSSLLKTYQTFRSNTRSPEAPVNYEDLILEWQLDELNEDASPPFLKLVPRFPETMAEVSAVYIYEVNYSAMAGVVRENHPLDLTQLFVAFDLAVCLSRTGLDPDATTPLCHGRPPMLANCLQRVSGVFAAATVPILGVPSIALRNYTETLVHTFTRFFEDVATFALDKNGEKLISAHLDRTIENIVTSGRFTGAGAAHPSELVIAAHSLGSVVVHNHLVRHWATRAECVPALLLTFGSPIGLITWLWLFLDFPGFEIRFDEEFGENFFCWRPQDNRGPNAPQQLRWINVLNRLDPIATAFNASAADLTRTEQQVRAALRDGEILHRYCGESRLSATGAAHADYLHDRGAFIKILLSACALGKDDPATIACAPAATHWSETARTLNRARVVVWIIAMLAAASYCGIVAWTFDDWRLMQLLPLFAVPPLTISGVAFCQRLLFGGATKRIPPDRIAGLPWRDLPSIPYRMRLWFSRRDVDPEAPRRSITAGLMKFLSFVPTLMAMLAPVAVAWTVTGIPPTPRLGAIGWYLTGLAIFAVYLIMCAAFELIAAWRAVLRELELVPGWTRPPHRAKSARRGPRRR